MTERAILFDTRSIQRYIFSGNTLKTNIGASYLVDHIFEDILLGDILSEENRKRYDIESVDFDSWKAVKAPKVSSSSGKKKKKKSKSKNNQTKPETIPENISQKEVSQEIPIDTLSADCYVAYIGGGNALLLFRAKDKDYRKDIIRDFTTVLLVKCPGLKTGSALGDIDMTTPEAFQQSMGQLYAVLKKNQNSIFPNVNVPYTGLTLICDVNGETANYYDMNHLLDAQPRFYSQEVHAKTEAARKANEELKKIFASNLGDNYSFPMELDKLGQREGENDIAIIHVDGNQMGIRFNNCQNMAERSQLSREVKEHTRMAFARLLDSIIAEYDTYMEYFDLKKNYLPIRPLILGGDDVTFVCPARLAITYAKRFIEYMHSNLHCISSKPRHIASCAGIAILPTSYPFFRGYELAEQLCDAAKVSSRKQDDTCWLDFAILHGEQAPKLHQIREEEYMGTLGNMHFGPYLVQNVQNQVLSNDHDLSALLNCAAALQKLPGTKVKGLRFILQRDWSAIHTFMEQWHHMNLTIPDIPQWKDYEETLWHPDSDGIEHTPYVDAIEMMDYYIPQKAEQKEEK
ncbi:hypothetical protein HF872_10225 [Megasphaera hexanoica]|uniref:Cas10/Cmr2 second palm domain-containing protein n=1 Tax=Megasphaera hexanoica TaxID=1675036 RepID=A0A848BRJ3_9FIRM|nr:hypothetical protein [Megasphaera hexanoica]NME28991.1 hypothetical protein [Megasphaera hexanoica]